MKTQYITALIFSAMAFTACESTPEPAPEIVEVTPPVLKTCTEISALTRVEIPAETKTFYAITEIENPPYEPIQRKDKQVRVINCLLYTSPSPRDLSTSRMPSSA